MIWDKIFWLWFAFVAVAVLYMLSEEVSTFNLVFGSMVIGLGLIKLASERSEKDQRLLIKRRLLDKLKK